MSTPNTLCKPDSDAKNILMSACILLNILGSQSGDHFPYNWHDGYVASSVVAVIGLHNYQ